MDWYQNLYIGETAKKKKPEIISKVEAHRTLYHVYLIITAPGEQNQLEILTPREYYKQAARKGESLIVGIAGSMTEAKEIVCRMTEEVFQKTGTVRLKEYFIQKQKG